MSHTLRKFELFNEQFTGEVFLILELSPSDYSDFNLKEIKQAVIVTKRGRAVENSKITEFLRN